MAEQNRFSLLNYLDTLALPATEYSSPPQLMCSPCTSLYTDTAVDCSSIQEKGLEKDSYYYSESEELEITGYPCFEQGVGSDDPLKVPASRRHSVIL